MPIPLSKPHLPPHALANVARVLASGKLSGDGAWCHKVEARLREDFHLPHPLLTSSGTHALELAAQLAGAEPGAEAIMPSFTFVSTANAFLRAGMRPAFVDIDPRTLTLDPADAARAVTPRTRAIVPVHYAGVGCDMDAIMELARRHDLFVVEDAAHAIGARYGRTPLGTIGDAGCFSWHDTKNLCAGEGGALALRNPEHAHAAEILREKGTNRAQFLRGEVDKYTWIDVGSSSILSEILAAVLDAQFDVFPVIQDRRRAIYEFYCEALRDLERRELLTLPVIPPPCASNYHLFHLLLPTEAARDRLQRYLRSRDIQAPFHYVPLHTSPYWRRATPDQRALPVTEDVAARLLRLPLYPDLTEEDRALVAEEVRRGVTATLT